MSTETDRAFARIARRLEPDLAAELRDVRPRPRPRPGRTAAVTAVVGVVLVLVTSLPVVPGLYGVGILVALASLADLVRAVAHDWTAPPD